MPTNTTKIVCPAKKGDYSYGCNECGEFAWWKPCFVPGENKGSYTPGRGYTNYLEKPIKVCSTRHQMGCPVITFVPVEGKDYRTSVTPPPNFCQIAEYLDDDLPKMTQKARSHFRTAIRGLKEANRYLDILVSRVKELEEIVEKIQGLGNV